MADHSVKWIKLKTSLFDDEQFKLIEAMPEADTIYYIWMRLMILAGKCNQGGYVVLNEQIPYTPDMLSTIFGRKKSIIISALESFKSMGMIEIDEKGIYLQGFEEEQNLLELNKKRELTRIRVSSYREKNKLIEDSENGLCNALQVVTDQRYSNDMKRGCNATDKIRLEESRSEKNPPTPLARAKGGSGKPLRKPDFLSMIPEVFISDAELMILLRDWVEKRSVGKSKLTELGFRQQLKRLQKWLITHGREKTMSCLEEAIANEWMGIREPKNGIPVNGQNIGKSLFREPDYGSPDV